MARLIRFAMKLCAVTTALSLVAWAPAARAEEPAPAAEIVPDAAFATCLKRAAKVDALTEQILAGLKDVNCYDPADAAISDLTGAELLTSVTDFLLKSTALTDVTPLAQLDTLRNLKLDVPATADLTPLAGLTDLARLHLVTSPQHDLGFLDGMTLDGMAVTATGVRPFKNAGTPTTRESISITGDDLTDLSDFAEWSAPAVVISAPKVTDLAPLVNNRVDMLMVSRSAVSDLTAIGRMTGLTLLIMADSSVSDLTPLADLTNLRQLQLAGSSQLSDLSGLAGLPSLQLLELRGTGVTDVSVLATLPSLKILDVSSTGVTSLGPPGSLSGLISLFGYNSALQNIDALKGATALRTVFLWDAQITDISPLADLPDGANLELKNNRIHDFSPLAGWSGDLDGRGQVITLPDLVAEAIYPIAVLDEKGQPLRGDSRYKDGALRYFGPNQQVFLSNALAAATITVTVNQKVTAGQKFTKTRTPTIVGGKKPKVGQTLTVSVPAWTPATTWYTYTWLGNGRVVIDNSTSNSYTLTSAEYNTDLRVYVTGHREGYEAAIVASDFTGYVGKGDFASTPAPKVTGTRKVGQKLTATVAWTPKPTTVTYQWYRNGSKIKKATKSTYKLTKADRGKRIAVKVTGKKRGYQVYTRTSVETARIAKAQRQRV